MPIHQLTVVLLSFVALLTGCDQRAMFEEFFPKEETALAKHILGQLASKDFALIEQRLDPSIKGKSVRGDLEQMASIVPAEVPRAINAVGANTSTANGVTTYDLTFEYEYANAWLLTNVVLQRRDGEVTVVGMHVNPRQRSLEEVNGFSLEGKSALHYIVFALVVAVPLFIVYSLALCVRTPIAKRKWLWLVFVALGFIQFSLDWSTGVYGVRPLSFALLGAGFFRAGPYAPFIFNVTIPIGAMVFLARRRALLSQNAG